MTLEMGSEDPPVPEQHTAKAHEEIQLDPLNELARRRLGRMYSTKGARFEAARRHKITARSSTIAIIILSTYLFAISVFLLTFKDQIQNGMESILKSISLIMSFFVVAFSLLQSSKRHDLRSEMFLKCAQAIDEIWTKLDREASLGSVTAENIKHHDDEYQRIITNFPDNHSDFDYQIFRFKTRENPRRIKDFIPRNWARARRIYWKSKVSFYIWKNVYLALVLPWIIFGIAYFARIHINLI